MSDRKHDVGFNSLIEDVFGLNIRGLITIRDTVVRPGKVADAAHDPDWLGTYTPSLRLVFFLLTITSVLRFIWAPDDGALIAQLNEAFQDRVPEGAEVATATDQYLATYGALYPVFAILLSAAVAFFMRIWGRDANYALRIRLHLMVLIPSSAFSIFSMAAFGFYDGVLKESFLALTILGLIVGMMLDLMVTVRTTAAAGVLNKIRNALAFTIVNQVTFLSSALLSARIAVSIATNSL